MFQFAFVNVLFRLRYEPQLELLSELPPSGAVSLAVYRTAYADCFVRMPFREPCGSPSLPYAAGLKERAAPMVQRASANAEFRERNEPQEEPLPERPPYSA